MAPTISDQMPQNELNVYQEFPILVETVAGEQLSSDEFVENYRVYTEISTSTMVGMSVDSIAAMVDNCI